MRENNYVINQLLNELEEHNINDYGSDFLATWDKSIDEIKATLVVAEILHDLYIQQKSARIFQSGLAVSWFKDKSTRTRYSFAAASGLLGLTLTDLDEEKSQISHGETVKETVNMISFLTKVIGIRDDKYLGVGHDFMKQVVNSINGGFENGVLTDRPSVINLQSDVDHPTQSLSDLLHLKKYFGNLKNLHGKKMVMSWAYSPSYGKPLSVAQGIIGLLSRFGMDITLAYPEGYGLIEDIENKSAKQAKFSGGKFQIVHDMKTAFAGADIVYPKSWAPYWVMQKRTELLRNNDSDGLNQLEQTALMENAKYKNWECSDKLMKLTKNEKALYMHCLPADISGLNCQNGEVSQSVFEKYKWQTYTEAGYKPYIIAAMIMLTKFKNPEKLIRRMLV
jgi:knotted carbamoyltransferase YgeW